MSASGSSKTASSLLNDLFSRAELQLDIPYHAASSASSSSRDVAFYDEHLEARLRLRLPASSAHLPAPQRGHATYSIPLTLDDDDDDIDWEERTEQARSTRLVLLAILCNLAIEARGSYVSPRPPTSTRDVVVPPTTANSVAAAAGVIVEDHARPKPAMSEPQREAQYQNIDAALGDEIGFYSVAWQGNKVPSRPASKQRSVSTSSTLPCTVVWHSPSTSWIMEWPVIVPITYARHRHPNPALLITASLSLRLSPSSPLLAALTAELSGQTQYLAMLPPELRPALRDDEDNGEDALSWADHDLLSTLSSGPVYPDESPSQRAARAASALAKLPLSRLPTKVLGSRLATPERSARDVGKKMQRGIEDEESGGAESDLTDQSSSASSSAASSSSARSYLTRTSSASSDFSDPAAYGAPKAKSIARDDEELDHGTSIVTLSRSVRRGLDVRSAVGVRMRTTMIEDVELPLHGASTSSRALVLSVEVDNPADSGLVFQVANCDVEVVQPSPPSWQADARLVEGGSTRFDLAQGEQRNLVYFVRFITGPTTAAEALASSGSTMRSISIVVHGKPAMLGGHLLTPDFSSVWSCTLDFRSLLEDAARREALTASRADAPQSSATTTMISGSHRHAATALQQARANDEETRAAVASTTTTIDQRPGVDRSSSGLANGPLARFTSSASRPGQRTSSLQPSPSSTLPLPSPLRQVSASSSTSSSSTAISPAGLGLLAQAKLRAASAADRVASQSGLSSSHEGDASQQQHHARVSSLASVASSASRARTSSTSSMRSNSASWDRAPSGSSTLYGPRDRVRRSVSTAMTATRPVPHESMVSGDSSYAARSVTPSTPSFDTVLQQRSGAATAMGTQVILPVRKGPRPLSTADQAPLLISTRVVIAPPSSEGEPAEGHRVRYAWISVDAALREEAIERRLADAWSINYVAAQRSQDDQEGGDAPRLDADAVLPTQAKVQAIVAGHSGAAIRESTVLPLQKNVMLALAGSQGVEAKGTYGSVEVPLLVVLPAKRQGAESNENEGEDEAVMRLIDEGALELSCDGERSWTLKMAA